MFSSIIRDLTHQKVDVYLYYFLSVTMQGSQDLREQQPAEEDMIFNMSISLYVLNLYMFLVFISCLISIAL